MLLPCAAGRIRPEENHPLRATLRATIEQAISSAFINTIHDGRYFGHYLGRSAVDYLARNLSRIEFAFTYCASYDDHKLRMLQASVQVEGIAKRESPKERTSQSESAKKRTKGNQPKGII